LLDLSERYRLEEAYAYILAMRGRPGHRSRPRRNHPAAYGGERVDARAAGRLSQCAHRPRQMGNRAESVAVNAGIDPKKIRGHRANAGIDPR